MAQYSAAYAEAGHPNQIAANCSPAACTYMRQQPSTPSFAASPGQGGGSYVPAPTAGNCVQQQHPYPYPGQGGGSYVPAPTNSYVPAPGSYVPAPAASGNYVPPQAQGPPLNNLSMIMPIQAPSMPAALAQGTLALPDAEAIERQKTGYMKLLDDQLKQGTTSLDSQRKAQTDYLFQQAEQQKRLVVAQLDQQIKQQEMQVQQHFHQEVLRLQKHISSQKAALEHQAMQLILDFKQKKGQEEMLTMQYHLQKEHAEAQQKLSDEFQRLQQAAPAGMF